MTTIIATLIDRIDSIPSTHLYFAAVATSIVFSFLLLNSGDSTHHALMPPDAPTDMLLSTRLSARRCCPLRRVRVCARVCSIAGP